MSETLTRKALADAVAESCTLSKSDSAKVVEAVLLALSKALISGQSVELRGFGCLRPRVDPGRIVRDPRNPAAGSYRMEPRVTVKFIPGSALRAEMNEAIR